MAILAIEKSPAFARPARGKGGTAGPGLVPRRFLRLSVLLTIGMAASTAVLTLLGIFTGDAFAVFAVGVMAIAVWQGLSSFIALILIIHRFLVALCEQLLMAIPWPSPGPKPQAADPFGDVADDWMDGPR